MRLRVQFSSAVFVLALSLGAPVHSTLTSQAQPQATHTAIPAEPIDINTASIDQLIKIPGLTRTWAARIIRFRPYRGKNDLLDRGIVTAEVYARIKDHIIAHRIRP